MIGSPSPARSKRPWEPESPDTCVGGRVAESTGTKESPSADEGRSSRAKKPALALIDGEETSSNRHHTSPKTRAHTAHPPQHGRNGPAADPPDPAPPAYSLSPLLSKPVLSFTDEELQWRQRRMGSSLSMYDRIKFEQEFDPRQLKLSPSERAVWDANPHMRQVFANGRALRRFPGAFAQRDRVIHEGFPQTPYHRRQGEAKTVEHWGQRKLLMSEIEFLTLFGSDTPMTVVYAGAAPGTHINFLAEELFPNLTFVLVDPAPFNAVESESVHIRRECFTDATASEFRDRSDVLFVSDIRVWKNDAGEAEIERQIAADMASQQAWTRMIRPRAAMLKFRLPYTPGQTPYLDGRIFLPVWGGRTTTEARLVVTDCDSVRTYSHEEYQNAMFHFNTEFRTTYFEHTLQDGEGIDHCFDCMSEIHILREYFARGKRLAAPAQEVDRRVAEMSRYISTQISGTGRTLCLPLDGMGVR